VNITDKNINDLIEIEGSAKAEIDEYRKELLLLKYPTPQQIIDLMNKHGFAVIHTQTVRS